MLVESFAKIPETIEIPSGRAAKAARFYEPTGQTCSVTRSHKFNERDHQGLRDGTASDEQHLPRYFAKAGFVDNDPKKVKKDGSGKANWGNPGDEVQDGGYNLHHPRRRSNSSIVSPGFKSKFETIEHEPVFEEELHGDGGVDQYAHEREEEASVEGHDLERFESMSKSSVSSGEGIEEAKKM